MQKLLTNQYFKKYFSLLEIDVNRQFDSLLEIDWTVKNFKFFTAVSVMSSSKIEGEQLEVDSYVKHKMLGVEYLANLTEKPNDLFKAYEFARDNSLNEQNFLKAHKIATENLLPTQWRGVIRTGNMLIMEQHTNRVKYEAAEAGIVKKEMAVFWEDISELLNMTLTIDEVFYFAALIHLVFVKIHPFNDGNGRTARLLEKWFLSARLGEKAWFVASENYYYQHIKEYYKNLSEVGLFYDQLDYSRSLPFLLMLPQALVVEV